MLHGIVRILSVLSVWKDHEWHMRLTSIGKECHVFHLVWFGTDPEWRDTNPRLREL
jgi:hypothetical protein